MPKPPKNGSPVIRPTAKMLAGIIVLLLASSLALLLLGPRSQPQIYAAYFFLALLAATVTFGILGARGWVRMRNQQVGGSAAVFIVILGMMLKLPSNAGYEVNGFIRLNGAAVTNAVIVLVGGRPPDNVQNSDEYGQFRFKLNEARNRHEFQVRIPGWPETNLVAEVRNGRVNLDLAMSAVPLLPSTPGPFGRNWEICTAPTQACTLFLFDYLPWDPSQIPTNRLQTFQNLLSDRLDKGIRAHLTTFNLLEGLDFRVKRCSAAEIVNEHLATRAAAQLHVPAVVWGYIDRADNRLKSVMSVTLMESDPFSLHALETLGADVVDLVTLNAPIQDMPLAIASYLVGETYLRQGRSDLARRAYLHARELAVGSESRPDHLLRVLDSRLQGIQSRNPAAALTPLGG